MNSDDKLISANKSEPESDDPVPPSFDGIGAWNRNAIETFERLRDRISQAIQLVVEIHQSALSASRDASIVGVGQDLHQPLFDAVCEAQAIWLDTPIQRYLTRSEGPVYLDHLEHRPGPRVSGSCYHDLALGGANWLCECIQKSISIADVLRFLRFNTIAGDAVGQHLHGLLSHVSCETQQGIERWREEQKQTVKQIPHSAELDTNNYLESLRIRRRQSAESRSSLNAARQRRLRIEDAFRSVKGFGFYRPWSASAEEFAGLMQQLYSLLVDEGFGEWLDGLQGNNFEEELVLSLLRRNSTSATQDLIEFQDACDLDPSELGPECQELLRFNNYFRTVFPQAFWQQNAAALADPEERGLSVTPAPSPAGALPAAEQPAVNGAGSAKPHVSAEGSEKGEKVATENDNFKPVQQADEPDTDALLIGKWLIRPGEASFDGGSFFDVDGAARQLLIRLVEAKERTVSNGRLKSALGNDLMEDETLRNHVHRLNRILKRELQITSNPIKAVDGAYRLRLSQSTEPQTKNKRTSNAGRDRR